MRALSSKVACKTDKANRPNVSSDSWMRTGCDLLKIVHAFPGRETVLFEFTPGAAVPVRRVLPRSLYNEKIQSVGRTFRVPMDLKSTINLPKTAFPMKAGLPQNEPKILARWEEQRIYDRIREVRKRAPTYVWHDGPQYANGPIHLGTAMNKCLKDFIVKSKNMAGFDSPYVPGWDCHGLPIEIKVDQMLGGKKLQMAAVDVRTECRKYAEKFLDLQRSQFKRIGVFGRFGQPYSTMTAQYEAAVLDILYRFLENDFVYKGLRSAYWCVFDETALAEAEVEYENHTSPTVWVKYQFAGDPASLDAALKGKKVFTIIWTTTPWTLPASMAVAFHPDEEYVALEAGPENNDDVFILGPRPPERAQKTPILQSPTQISPLPP